MSGKMVRGLRGVADRAVMMTPSGPVPPTVSLAKVSDAGDADSRWLLYPVWAEGREGKEAPGHGL